MKHQEQVLQRDLGIPDDPLYNGTSAGTNPLSSPEFRVQDGDYGHMYTLYFKYMGLRNITLSIPTYLGNQVFESSTDPIPKFNYCWNSKLGLINHPVGICYVAYNSATTWFTVPYRRYAIPVNATVPDPLDLIDWSKSQLASNRAWWAMQPRFQGDFDGLNFLFELKDFKDIAKGFAALRPSQIADTLKRAKARIARARRAIENGSASQQVADFVRVSTRSASEALLFKRFAIDPTVRDYMELSAQLKNLISDVQHRFRDKGATENRRHYSEKISEWSVNSVVGTKNNYWYRTGTEGSDYFTATMEFTYDYKLRDTMDALKRYYGMDFTAGVAWNAMPFTFLIDYVCRVGDAIENMTTDPNVLLKMHQYCESRLVTVKSGLKYNLDGRVHAAIINGKVARDGQIISGYQGTLYERRVVPPSKGVALPRLKMPSVKQAQNIVALVRCMW